MAVRNTFTATFRAVDIGPSRDGFAAVFNRTDNVDGKVVRVHQVRTVQPSGSNSDVGSTLGLQGRIGLYRITAYSGGTEKTFGAYDTSSGSLPSQVKLVVFPDSVTTSDHLRSFGDAFSFTITQAIPFQAMLRAPGLLDGTDGGRREFPSAEQVWGPQGDDSLEGIVCREGEGIALVRRDYGQPQAFHWTIRIKDNATGDCYCRTLASGGSVMIGSASFAFFNGSGSGATYTVYAIGFPDFGESNIPRVRVAKITGYDYVSGDTPATGSIAVHDTDTDTTGVEVPAGPFIAKTWGKDNGLDLDYLNYQTTIPIAAQQRAGTYRQVLQSDPWYSLTHSPVLRFENADMVYGYSTASGSRDSYFPEGYISLNPGEGLALLGGGGGLVETSEMAYYNIEFVCEIVEPDAVAGGGNTYSRARVVNA